MATFVKIAAGQGTWRLRLYPSDHEKISYSQMVQASGLWSVAKATRMQEWLPRPSVAAYTWSLKVERTVNFVFGLLNKLHDIYNKSRLPSAT